MPTIDIVQGQFKVVDRTVPEDLTNHVNLPNAMQSFVYYKLIRPGNDIVIEQPEVTGSIDIDDLIQAAYDEGYAAGQAPEPEPEPGISPLWSTSFDYSSVCTQGGAGGGADCADVENDGIIWNYGNAGVPVGSETEWTGVVAAANNSNGSGGYGFRTWVDDGVNIGTGLVQKTFPALPEFWLRWYQRYEPGFKWVGGNPSYDKNFYLRCASGLQVLPQFAGSDFQLTIQSSGAHSQQVSSGGYFGSYGVATDWQDVFGTTSDGLFHMFEMYLKMDTSIVSTTEGNGVGRLWIDGALVAENTAVNFSNGNAVARQGFTHFDLSSNQSNPDNGRIMYEDFDDIALYDTDPGNTDAAGNPWIGPLNGFSGGS